MLNIDECAELGESVAREAGRILLKHYRTDFAVEHKGTVNLVTEVDLAAEEWIVSRIRKAFPSHSILAEEKHSNTPEGEISWVIDPLDGTTNYAHGYPAFSVSIGLEVRGELEWGAVFDPVRDELYTARKGGGAFCNGIPQRVSKVSSLDAGLLATGFPYDIRTDSQTNLDNFCAFAVRTQGLRRSGSAALDFCSVAAGRLDGFWELKLNPWDCAAGYLIVRESGGTVTNFRGRLGTIYDREVVASNGLIHQEMLMVLETIKTNSRFQIPDSRWKQ
ncbi:MAG TPA: inositol monophosphatase family protein [Acidobacteriota bacterium]|nr:inositol monophosphatase family protein [Acidobacteriota bacterium]